MEKYVKKLGRSSLFISVLLTVLGFLMTFKSQETVSVFIVFFGYVLVVDGLIHCASYFTIDRDLSFFSYELAQAIIDILLGFFVVANANSVSFVLPITLGLWVVLDGILKIQIALNIRGIRNTNWGIMFVSALVAIFIGFAILFNPIKSLDLLVKVCGVALIITQLLSIYDDIYFLSEVKEISKESKSKAK